MIAIIQLIVSVLVLCMPSLFVADVPTSPSLVPLSQGAGPSQKNTSQPPTQAQAPPQVPLPASVEVKRDHTVVKQKPTIRVKRRGVVMKGARLPVFERMNGYGCRGSWYRIHDDAWICSSDVKISSDPPKAKPLPTVPSGKLTPWPYGFVREPTMEYRIEGRQLVEVRELQKGFGFGVASYFRIDDAKYLRTAEDTLIPRSAAGVAGRVSTFEGMIVRNKTPWPIGFVNRRHAPVYSEPTLKKKFRIPDVAAERYTPFKILETSGKNRRGFVRFDEGAWLRNRDVRITRKASLPKGVAPGERWIDVDTTQQVMTAYEGEIPVYTTLVSSGRFGSPTVKGKYRIWAKVAAIAMDNTDEELETIEVTETDTDTADTDSASESDTEERHLYSLHDVPWTQFFHESYALHGVYWHDTFGNRKSHGCVNLSPKDARWFYNWTLPKIPPGFWAVYSTKTDPGTLVRIR